MHRAPASKQFAESVKIAELEPDRIFGMPVIEKQPIHDRITFAPTERGTRFRFRVHGQPTGMVRHAQQIQRPLLRRNFASFCANLRALFENAPPER